MSWRWFDHGRSLGPSCLKRRERIQHKSEPVDRERIVKRVPLVVVRDQFTGRPTETKLRVAITLNTYIHKLRLRNK